MTKKHFEAMASIIAGIRNGLWTNELPCWADSTKVLSHGPDFEIEDNYTRAVQAAEAFIMLASQENPRFDRTRFLNACGLLDHKPQRKGGKS